jgi:hypothetical protein
VLTFTVGASLNCAVETAPALGNPWTTITNYAAVSTNRTIQITVPTTGAKSFYRLRSP